MQSNSRIKRYLIKNIRVENAFLAKEYTNYSVKNFCGKSQQIDIKLFDAFKREVLFCRRLFRCSNCLCPCCLQSMQVMAQPSQLI